MERDDGGAAFGWAAIDSRGRVVLGTIERTRSHAISAARAYGHAKIPIARRWEWLRDRLGWRVVRIIVTARRTRP